MVRADLCGEAKAAADRPCQLACDLAARVPAASLRTGREAARLTVNEASIAQANSEEWYESEGLGSKRSLKIPKSLGMYW